MECFIPIKSLKNFIITKLMPDTKITMSNSQASKPHKIELQPSCNECTVLNSSVTYSQDSITGDSHKSNLDYKLIRKRWTENFQNLHCSG